ncbi:FAD-binding oxidoreductase [Aciditerrimonas ferrireducens]|uniref:FAD-binding oxidoreductase n=1 Tax=Aciditerrimonas ferrireducens TaxID=667306 RepID=UPI0020031FB9|nr:FAD-binding oxidoreductase [Aciditerrimonas ferrireducens]MCK4176750.1 FAD-binding oxidoreductase [Aciditerrimonas ferrireducens]
MPPPRSLPAGLLAELKAALGERHVLVDPEVLAGASVDWTGRFRGPASGLVRPGSTEEVAAVVRACAAAEVPLVVQGGNTGLVGGSVPPPPEGDRPAPLVLSTRRLDAIGPVDQDAAQLTAGAGATLEAVQEAARNAGLRFGVDLAARGSATVGGMVATNAGGLHVLRYGPMRHQVVGVEAVLGDGSVVSRLGGLLKDNTGYDLSQLLVGAEGTLGVVTAVRLRLHPQPRSRAVALVGLGGTADAVALVGRLRRAGAPLSAVELCFAEGVALVCRAAGLPPPFPGREPPALLVVELEGEQEPLALLEPLIGDPGVHDELTAVALDDGQAARLWAYRERHTEAVATVGVAHKLDVTLPLAELAAFEAEVRGVVARVAPDATLVLFGHVGDGNLHVNVVGPPPDDDRVDDAVLRLVARFGGSISAEHGIGRAKVPWLHLSRSPAELAAMAALKRALDPAGILNPGVLLPAAPIFSTLSTGEVGKTVEGGPGVPNLDDEGQGKALSPEEAR